MSAADLEKPAASGHGDGVVRAAVRRWRQQDLLDKAGTALRGAAWALSLLAFVVMAANQHGDWMQFDLYEEYRYLVAVGALAFLYTTLQLVRHGVRLTGGQDMQGRFAGLADFAGDQVAAYLLISAVSAAIPITNRMRAGVDNAFTDSSAASITIAFFAFLCLSLSALISGFNLSKLINAPVIQV